MPDTYIMLYNRIITSDAYLKGKKEEMELLIISFSGITFILISNIKAKKIIKLLYVTQKTKITKEDAYVFENFASSKHNKI